MGHALRHIGQMEKRRFTRVAELPRCQLGERIELVLNGFESHLLEVRGLQPRTVDGILLHARRLLTWYRVRCPRRKLRDFRGVDVLAFVGSLSRSCGSAGSRVAAVSHMRGLLRYLHGEGIVRRDLAGIVPRVPSWQHAGLPRHLAWTEVRAVVDAIDASTSTGKRDRALLLLLATTGLRSQEVRRLELRDIDWHAAELHIRRTKVRRQRVVPLVAEAGRALADYLLHGRPSSSLPSAFLQHVAPVGPLRNSSTVAAIVLRRLKGGGYTTTRGGAHLFRHSLATRLVQDGQPIKEIADVLGHQHIDTTAIYIKVAVPQLACVALPFPRARSKDVRKMAISKS